MLSHPRFSTIPMSLSPPTQPLWSHTLQIIPSSSHSSKGHWEHWMALIFQLTLLLQTGHAITTTRVASHRMSLQPPHSTCTFATSSVVGREVLLMGGSFMMLVFMIWSFHLGSITLQMLAIPSVMLSWCHSMGFGITSRSWKAMVFSV